VAKQIEDRIREYYQVENGIPSTAVTSTQDEELLDEFLLEE
jgi:hypothetical protein